MRVLVIEDLAPIRHLIAAYLEAAGYSVVSAADGLEGWNILKREGTTFDVVLLDRQLPGLDGMEVLARIKADPDLSGIPVILETAADSREEIAEGIRAGAYYYLTKPIEREVLVSLAAAAAQDGIRYKRLRHSIKRHNTAYGLMTAATFHFRTLEEGSALAVALAQACPSPSARLIGLSELLTNAVEHGNLGITHEEKAHLIALGDWDTEVNARLATHGDKAVLVDFRRLPDRIEIAIKDEGEGFDWDRYVDFDPGRISGTHGRGIALARSLSFDAITYRGCGNEVVATINHPAEPSVRTMTDDDGLAEAHTTITTLKRQIEAEDLGAARTMMANLAPSPSMLRDLEAAHGVGLSAHAETCARLGGDLWGAIPIDGHRFALYLADFCGHGAPAAINAFRLDMLLRDLGPFRDDPAACLGVLNGRLASILATGHYATMVYGIVDLSSDEFIYAAAGAPHPIVVGLDGSDLAVGNGAGIPLGIVAASTHVARRLVFPPGTLLLIHSDGLAECGRSHGGALGRAGVPPMVADRVAQCNGGPVDAAAIVSPFLDTIPRPLSDDLTVACCVRPRTGAS